MNNIVLLVSNKCGLQLIALITRFNWICLMFLYHNDLAHVIASCRDIIYQLKKLHFVQKLVEPIIYLSSCNKAKLVAMVRILGLCSC